MFCTGHNFNRENKGVSERNKDNNSKSRGKFTTLLTPLSSVTDTHTYTKTCAGRATQQHVHRYSQPSIVHRRWLESPCPRQTDSHHQPFHTTDHRFFFILFFSLHHHIRSHFQSHSLTLSFSMQGISQPLLRKTSKSQSPPPKPPSPATKAPIGPPLPALFGPAISVPSLLRFLLQSLLFSLFYLSIFLFPLSLAGHREKTRARKTRSHRLWKTAGWSRVGHRNLTSLNWKIKLMKS